MLSTENIRWFADITSNDRAAVGGKGASLGELTRAGIAVPAGFVVRAAAFEGILGTLEKEEPIRPRVEKLPHHELERTTQLSEGICARIENTVLPKELRDEFFLAHEELCNKERSLPLAVRSSATIEDSDDASFAGLHNTYLWVVGAEAMMRSVCACWASLYSVPSISYRRKNQVPEHNVAMAVVVQRMVRARTAGVMFTRSPLTGDRSVITVEAAWGLGSAVVGGEVTPDHFIVSKITGEISAREISDKHIQHVPAPSGGIREIETPPDLRRAPSLTDKELMELKELGRRVERHYGKPQDIEWAIDDSGKIFLLQARPETVWATKDSAPVAKPAEDPMLHVMNIFGGRR